jgi:hypothetical protein
MMLAACIVDNTRNLRLHAVRHEVGRIAKHVQRESHYTMRLALAALVAYGTCLTQLITRLGMVLLALSLACPVQDPDLCQHVCMISNLRAVPLAIDNVTLAS